MTSLQCYCNALPIKAKVPELFRCGVLSPSESRERVNTGVTQDSMQIEAKPTGS